MRSYREGMRILYYLFISLSFLNVQAKSEKPDSKTSFLKAPAGYTIKIFNDQVEGARSITQSPSGTIFVGTRDSQVYAIQKGKLYTITKDLEEPNGVAFKDGSLYVAEVKRLLKFEKIEQNLSKPPKPIVVYDKLPKERHHGARYMAFGPDGYLYMGIGAPCNICNKESEDPRYAAIIRFKKLDGSDPEVFAKGIRNSVGFDWNPETKVMWFTDNGRDLLGDDKPGDELNQAGVLGLHFGYPFCHQGDLLDPEFGKNKKCTDYTKPKMVLGAHVAALGMRFLDSKTILIAQHGSWNRSTKVGYDVIKVTLPDKDGGSEKQKITTEPFLTGFLDGLTVYGRPVDIEVLSDKSILVSDDKAGVIYQLVPKK